MNVNYRMYALTTHLKAFRHRRELGGDAAYWANHSMFKDLDEVDFEVPVPPGTKSSVSAAKASFWDFFRGRPKPAPEGPAFRSIYKSIPEWMAAMPQGGPEDVCLKSFQESGNMAPHIAAAFAGSEYQAIGVRDPKEKKVQAWWENPRHPGFFRMTNEKSLDPYPVSVDAARMSLILAIKATDGFAVNDPGLERFHKDFEAAQECMQSDSPQVPHCPDMFPSSGYSLRARQLLSASCRAWVFGGMGSWNDNPPDAGPLRQQYDAISEKLYEAIGVGILAAINNGFTGE